VLSPVAARVNVERIVCATLGSARWNTLMRLAIVLISACFVAFPCVARGADPAKVGAAAADFTADDALVIGGGIGPGKAKGQEGKLRAVALVVEDPSGGRVCLVACDVLMLNRDVLDGAARRIAAETAIPFDHILINATHTHHAPTTVTIHGYEREEAFTKQVEEKIVEAAVAAFRKRAPATFAFRLGEESSVGRNSRVLLADGTIYWTGPRDDFVRPTGPFDPELPVLAFRRLDGSNEAILFNHSTHTIGTHTPAVRSPSFYGLAAQEIEADKGGTVLFFSGASGSTHNLDLNGKEMTLRIKAAVDDALGRAEARPLDVVKGKRTELSVTVRTFDEAKDEAAVAAYCNKRIADPKAAQKTIEVFRAMRKQVAPMQGQTRKTWVQAIVIGDVALVGVPGEFFTVLGQEIKRRSPYRYTYVFQLANDYIGYIPDQRGFDRGGYQTWTGLHSFVERGTGEKVVDAAVELLKQLYAPSAR
jgi:neutral ceramidase